MNFALLRRLLVASLALLVPACAADTDDGLPDEDDDFSESVQASTGNLMVAYDLAKPCTIFLNMPGDGVDDNSNWKTTGTYITWRYNMNSEWALVSDPKRAGKTYPWWGFTRRDCIKGEPERIKAGRSNVAASGWRTVQTDVPPASVTSRTREVHSDSTLRDPANFAIGNVPKGWHVDVTGNTRSGGFWVEVYVPNAKRWGFIEASHLKP